MTHAIITPIEGTSDFKSDKNLELHSVVCLKPVNIWGFINYFFQKKDTNEAVVKIRTNCEQESKYINVIMPETIIDV